MVRKLSVRRRATYYMKMIFTADKKGAMKKTVDDCTHNLSDSGEGQPLLPEAHGAPSVLSLSPYYIEN